LIVLDTSFLYALIDGADERHAEALAWYERSDEEGVTTPMVVAELDHLVAARAGGRALEAMRGDLLAAAYAVEWSPSFLSSAIEVARSYSGLGVGLADAGLVALAERLGTIRVATFDERHFRAVRPLTGEPAFELLPLDA